MVWDLSCQGLLHCLGSFALDGSCVKHGSLSPEAEKTTSISGCWFYLGSSEKLYLKHGAKRYDNF